MTVEARLNARKFFSLPLEAFSKPRTRSAAVPSRSGHEDGTGLKWFGIAGSLNPLRVWTPALRGFENGSLLLLILISQILG